MQISKLLELTQGGRAIFESYDLPIEVNILSPLNSADTKPSFRIYWSKRDNKFKYHDFGDNVHGDAIDFVAAIENVTIKEAIKLIIKIMKSQAKVTTNVEPKNQHVGSEKKVSTKIKEGIQAEVMKPILNSDDEEFGFIFELCKEVSNSPKKEEQELPDGVEVLIDNPKYCSEDHINYKKLFVMGDVKSLLQRFNVLCVDIILYWGTRFDRAVVKKVFSSNGQPVYAYEVGENKYKIYKPTADDPKFKHYFIGSGTINENFIFGLKQVNVKKKYVIITAGMKDTLSAASLGLNVITLNSEREKFDSGHISLIRKQFGGSVNIFSLYDNDSTGREMSRKLEEDFEIPSLTQLVFDRDLTNNTINKKDFADVMEYFIKYNQGEQIKQLFLDIMDFIKEHSKPEGNTTEVAEDTFVLRTSFAKPIKPRRK